MGQHHGVDARLKCGGVEEFGRGSGGRLDAPAFQIDDADRDAALALQGNPLTETELARAQDHRDQALALGLDNQRLTAEFLMVLKPVKNLVGAHKVSG